MTKDDWKDIAFAAFCCLGIYLMIALPVIWLAVVLN